MNENIIDPIPAELIEAELTEERFLRDSNKASNKLYVLDGREAPNTMKEIGRLREIAFRTAGGGTGKSCDIDSFDVMENPCKQLIVWDPKNRIILGGYRFITGDNIRIQPDGKPCIATSHMFEFSDEFIRDYLPYTIELGRSFVRPEFQSSKAGAKALYALDNLWDGLGALTVEHPDMKYLFGKVTMYPNYSTCGRDMILFFLKKHFPDRDHLVWPTTELATDTDTEEMSKIFTGTDFKTDYKILNTEVRKLGYNIPPLVNAYMSLSPTMRMFGTAINDEFGDVEESGIFLVISEILEEKKHRHISTYHK
ncbi:MAG: GNAT family N-acetyltransferase [Muribaculaceae bacterium]|nr:GNAT family N-acetyltransferase [Muribaculaceae bacterium]